ncbi:hypothetical protein [Moorena sp. SIO3H5]|nr:hypothetical protein [Moorena sp. SIO3H5]
MQRGLGGNPMTALHIDHQMTLEKSDSLVPYFLFLKIYNLCTSPI